MRARAVFRYTTPSRILAKASESIMPEVSSVTGACTETTSERASSCSNVLVASAA